MPTPSLTYPNPLKADADGVLRVGKTRVTLDTVITAFELGATPEQIVQQFPSLSLELVYATISTYLHNQSELQSYLANRRLRAQQKLDKLEQQPHMQGIRQRLMTRAKASE